MAVSKAQAVGMMHKKFREAVRRSRYKNAGDFSEKLYEIKIDTEYLSKLNVLTFVTADEQWLDFVLMCRAML